jgi:hypothetical protein
VKEEEQSPVVVVVVVVVVAAVLKWKEERSNGQDWTLRSLMF